MIEIPTEEPEHSGLAMIGRPIPARLALLGMAAVHNRGTDGAMLLASSEAAVLDMHSALERTPQPVYGMPQDWNTD